MNDALCSTDGCPNAIAAKSLCKPCYNKQWRKNNAGYFKDYRADHREARSDAVRRWREENPEEWEAWKSEYYERNKARYAEHCSKRVAVLRGAAFVERVAKKKLREMDGDRCAYCEVDLSFAPKRRGEWRADAAEVDHVIPVSAGGMHSYANTALACAKCNREKGSSTRWNLTVAHRLAQTTGG